MPSLRKLSKLFGFGGGLNKKTSPPFIDDSESPNMQNMVSDEYQTSFKRKGTSRYNAQALSKNSIKGLYRGYKSDGTKKLVACVDANIYAGTDATGVFASIKASLTANKYFSFETMNDKIIMTNYDDLPMHYDFASTVTALSGTPPKAKYCKLHKNYLIMGYCNYGSTAYPSRIWYSAIANYDVWGANNYENIRTDDGDVITGLGSSMGTLHIFKNRSIHAVTGKIFDPSLTVSDIVIDCILDGIGCIAPRSLVNTGDYYIFLASDGVRVFTGAISEIISTKVSPILDEIPSDTRANCVGTYDPVNKWYWLSYEDPTVLPTGVPNSMLALDIRLGNWYRFKGINANCFGIWSGAGDKNELYYGDSNDGFVNKYDKDFLDDNKLEKVIATFESGETWTGGAADTSKFKEGLRGLKLTINFGNSYTDSATSPIALDLTLFPDNSVSDDDDIIQVKFYKTASDAVTRTIEIYFDTSEGDFSANYYKGSATFGTGDESAQWFTEEIAKSSFTKTGSTGDWSTVKAIKVLFKGGLSDEEGTFDDLRLVNDEREAIDAYRFTKEVNQGTIEIIKRYKDLYHEGYLTEDWDLDIYAYLDDFSKNVHIKDFNSTDIHLFFSLEATRDIHKYKKSLIAVDSGADLRNRFGIAYDGTHIYVTQAVGAAGNLYKLLASDYSTIASDTTNLGYGVAVDDDYVYTVAASGDIVRKRKKSDLSIVINSSALTSYITPYGIAVDKDYVYVCGSHGIVILNKSDLSYKTSLTGQGAANNKFNAPKDITVDNEYIYVADTTNERIMKFLKEDLSFVLKIGSNGSGDDNFDDPYAIAVDETYIYVADKENKRIVKRLKSNFEYVSEVASHATYKPQTLCVNDYIYVVSPRKSSSAHIWREAKNVSFKFVNKTVNQNMKLYRWKVSFMPKTLR